MHSHGKHSHPHHEPSHSHSHSHVHREKFKTRTGIVVGITAVAMVAEIAFGYLTNSLALLSDGWHMSSHVLAIGMTWIAYYISEKFNFKYGPEKVLALSGYTSAMILLFVAVMMGAEAVERFIKPEKIDFIDAIWVSVIGFVVNGVSAYLLHSEHQHHDHNIRAAYLHVLADTVTSVAAIVSLLVGMYYQIYVLDAISGMATSLIIINWAVRLAWNSGKELVEIFNI